MKRKILGMLTCMLFIISVFPTSGNSNIFFLQEKDSNEKTSLSLLNFLNDPPYVPSNPDPINNSIDINLTINISWTGDDPDPGDKVTYNVFFGKQENPPNVANTWEDETYNPGKLEYNTQYYWRIDAYDGNHGVTEGPIWTFYTTDNQPPYQPNYPDPENNSIDVNTNINISWTGGDPDGDPVEYDIYFGTDPNPPNVATNYTNTTYYPNRLDYNTQYYWRIDAWDDYGYSTTGYIWSYTTRDDNPPNIPNNPDPENNSIDVNTNINISWTGGDPDGDPVEYDIYFGTDPNPPNVATNYTNTTYYPNRLDYNTQYYWRIDAWDDYGYSTTGYIWSYTTKDDNPPNIPSNPYPVNESTNINTNVELSWTGGDPDGDPVEYDVYFGTDPNPPNVEIGYLTTTYVPGTLELDTWYYWRIDARDDYGYTSTGHIWKFRTTIYDSNPPNKPNKPVGPKNGKPGISYTYTSNATDPDLDQIFYMFDWDDGTDSGWIGPYPSGENVEASHVWNTRGSYSIKVKAKDEYDVESVWSDPLPISMPKNKQDTTLGIILAFGFGVDVKIAQSETGEDNVDLKVLNKPLYIWKSEIHTISSGEVVRLFSAKGFFSPLLPFCFGTCQKWIIIS